MSRAITKRKSRKLPWSHDSSANHHLGRPLLKARSAAFREQMCKISKLGDNMRGAKLAMRARQAPCER